MRLREGRAREDSRAMRMRERTLTPTSIVKLIVEVIEPFRGRVFDPTCGSGGMFVQSFNFIRHHQKKGNDASKKIMIYGQEKREDMLE